MNGVVTEHTMPLDALLAGFCVEPPGAVTISGLTLDSRAVVPGDLFMAVAGSRSHGIRFLDSALQQGAAAVAVDAVAGWRESLPGTALDSDIPLAEVADLGQKAGAIAARFFAEPSRRMHVVGVTGTNGKTSVSHYVAQALQNKAPCGVIGTLGSGLFGSLESTGHTTPDAVSVQRQLNDFVDAGAGYTVMEVSSHALEQGRVAGVVFDTAVYTNLSHEHLDYHGDMATYAGAKRRLFDFPELRHAVINLDDETGAAWAEELKGAEVEVIGYSLDPSHTSAALKAAVTLSETGLSLEVSGRWGETRIDSYLLGRFNAANLLAALGALLAEGYELDAAADTLAQVQGVPGRMERFGGGDLPTVVVDYAHTADALEQALSALREHCRGRLTVVFGCGGDRDRAKRPQMGLAAQRLADDMVITDDNPRSESPQRIVAEIVSGLNKDAHYRIVHDRAEAIHSAISDAVAGDVVLVAGKGHETEQVIGSERRPFSDRAVVQQVLQEVADER